MADQQATRRTKRVYGKQVTDVLLRRTASDEGKAKLCSFIFELSQA